jgi:putative transposase
MIREASEESGFTLLETSAGADHVHVLLALRPTHSVASVVREIKGRTGMALLSEFPELRVWLRGNLTWEERYAVETVSAPRVERVRDRLRARHGPLEASDRELAAAS